MKNLFWTIAEAALKTFVWFLLAGRLGLVWTSELSWGFWGIVVVGYLMMGFFVNNLYNHGIWGSTFSMIGTIIMVVLTFFVVGFTGKYDGWYVLLLAVDASLFSHFVKAVVGSAIDEKKDNRLV